MNARGNSITLVGAGGAIGSHAGALLARSGCFKRITLIDADRYEHHNLSSQDIVARDVGRLKVQVQAERIRRIAPHIEVIAIAERVEHVPLGRLRASVIASGLDGMTARRHVNRAARRLGAPWVDAGVQSQGQFSRLDVFDSSADAACFECSWGAQEYAALDSVYPCDPSPRTPTPTRAPAYLGAFTAAAQCAQCVALVRGEPPQALLGRQLLVRLAECHHQVSTRRRSPQCAFDHARWTIQPLPGRPGAITVARALRLVAPARDASPRLRVAGDRFAMRLECPGCNASREVLTLVSRIRVRARTCTQCGTAMVAPGIDTVDDISLDRLSTGQMRASLHALGLRCADVFSIESVPGEIHHFEIGG